MLGLTLWGGWRWMKQERDLANEEEEAGATAVRVGLVAAVLARAAHSMVSGIIVMPVSQMLMVLILGWAWGRYLHQSGDAVSPSSVAISRRAHVVFSIILVASMAVVASSVQDLVDRKERQKAFVEHVDRNRLSPRYWAQGYIGVRDPEVMEQARHDR